MALLPSSLTSATRAFVLQASNMKSHLIALLSPFFVALFCLPILTQAAERRYELTIEEVTWNITGKDVDHALAINGSIPAPILKFQLGDDAVIEVTNKTTEPTSVHWHGVLVPWNMDGPMFSNNQPIQPGESFTFRFPIKHTGTYWYHSHTELQEQRGLYGAIVIEDHHERMKIDHDLVVVMSDWTDERPMDVLANLKKDGHYYAFKKKFFPSWVGAIRHGAVWNYIKGQWTRMGAMDLSDVGYDAFLINGKKISSSVANLRKGDRVRLRLINAGASSYFYVNIGNLRPFQVISKDGVDVMPVEVTELLMGMGETYDLVFEVPNDLGFELRATAQDVTGHASLILGDQENAESVPSKMKPNPYMMGMDHSAHTDMPTHPPEHQMPMDDQMPTEAVEEIASMPMTKRLHYSMLRSVNPTAFEENLPQHDIRLELSGDMDRYLWTINGKTFSEDKYIIIREGEVVRFTLVNQTMMHHPMHLHGHFFRVLNEQGDYSPLFHTIDVAPMKTETIELLANEPGIWFFHCHNLYHMKMGMARWVKYENFERPEELVRVEKEQAKQFTKDSDLFFSGKVDLYSNHAELDLRLNGGRYEADLTFEIDEYAADTLEADLAFKYYVDRYFAPLAGVEYRDDDIAGILGATYLAPGEIQMTGYMTTEGQAVIKLSKQFDIVDRLLLEVGGEGRFFTGEPEWEAEAELKYRIRQNLDFGVFYKWDEEKDHRVGLGFSLSF